METNKKFRNRITLPKRYILSVFDLVTPQKKRKNGCKALYIGEQKDNTRNVYKEYFIVSQEPRTKKTQKLVYMEKFLRYQNAETPE